MTRTHVRSGFRSAALSLLPSGASQRELRDAFPRRGILSAAIITLVTLCLPVVTLRADEHESVAAAAEPEKPIEPATPDQVFNSSENPTASSSQPAVKIDGGDGEESPTREQLNIFPSGGLGLRWIAPADGFGITDLELGIADHRPAFPKENRFNFGFPFAVSFIDEPQALGLPSELYIAQIETRFAHPFNDQLGIDLSVAPGFFSDFDAGSNNGFRVTGHGILTYRHSEELKLAIGAMYLGREDVPVLPAGGVVWKMDDNTRFELLMPKPRIVRRLWLKEDCEYQLYAGFELFGGNSWAVTRPDDSFDTFTYRDFRFVVGHESYWKGMLGGIFELGYVFARKLEFEHDPATLRPGGAFMLRFSSSF